MPDYEYRITDGEVECRQTQTGKAIINGYAAVFNTPSHMIRGRFVEVVKPGAFTKSIQEQDIRSYFNHDKNLILGRTGAGTLKVSEDAKGIYYEVEAPDTTYARDLLVSIERRDVSQSSFGFNVVGPRGETWRNLDGKMHRFLNEVRCFDVSPVVTPAYESATASLGSRSIDALCELRSIDKSELPENLDRDYLIDALLDTSLDLNVLLERSIDAEQDHAVQERDVDEQEPDRSRYLARKRLLDLKAKASRTI